MNGKFAYEESGFKPENAGRMYAFSDYKYNRLYAFKSNFEKF